jgi:SAM-dependent methyltransferase
MGSSSAPSAVPPSADQSAAGFLDFLLHGYVPAERERLLDLTTYLPGTTYPQICQTRTGLLYQALASQLGIDRAEGTRDVLDIGLYPGTQARALAQFLGQRIRLSGAGLLLDDAFVADLAPILVKLCVVDLDPFYAAPATGIRIDVPDSAFDAIYALEIIEHLISPLVLISECARLLRPGAILCLSTPNVSNVGAISQLLAGRSNYEALAASPMHQRDNKWRGHFRLYAKGELAELCARHGLELIHHEYYQEAGARYLQHAGANPLKTALRTWIAQLVPHFSDDQFMIFRRAADHRQPPAPAPGASPAPGRSP